MMNVLDRLRRVPDRILDGIVERRLGIATRGYKDVGVEGHVHYGTIGYRGSMAILRSLNDTAGKVLVDLGCGKGRFLSCAAQFPFAKVIGLEYDKELWEVGLRNAGRLRRRVCEIEIINCLAQEFTYGAGSYYYLFNPFSAEILLQVIGKIGRERTGPVVLIYVNPRHDYVLHGIPWLEKYDSWDRGRHGVWYPASFWRCRETLAEGVAAK